MVRLAKLFLLSTGTLTSALILGSVLGGCQGQTVGGGGAGSVSSTSAGSGSTGGASSTTGTGGQGGTSTTTSASSPATASASSTATTGASSTATTSASSTSSTSTSAGGMGDGGLVTIADLTDPTAPDFVSSGPVQLVGVVATSSKFLVSKNAAGACLWGVFLSSPGIGAALPHSAILAVSYGTPAAAVDGGNVVFCPTIQAGEPAGDAFPDDTHPGDVLTVVGLAGSMLPASCTAPDAGPPDTSVIAQYQLGKVTSVVRTAVNAPVPAPHVLTSAEAATLAAGADATFLDAWGGARVTAANVTAELQMGSLLDPYGHLLLSDGLQVGDKLYYVGMAKAADACYGGPVFTAQTPTFSAVTGFVYLDFCGWNLQPGDKCHDLTPPSADCASVAGADAGAGTVCMH